LTTPHLGVVLCGDDPASATYVRNKGRAAERAGIRFTLLTPSADSSTADLLDLCARLSGDPDIDGMLVQLPLPRQIDTGAVLEAVPVAKDADGFHPLNLGRLAAAGAPPVLPGTPLGCMELLRRSGVPIAGSRAVVLGRSVIVGRPLALLLVNADATVTICHSKTRDLAAVCREADILVAAIGRAAMITGEYLAPGVTVIDVGMNRLSDRGEVARIFRDSPRKLAAFDKNGSVLVGDVDPFDVVEKAGAYSPVPGGVGPLTIAMLMANTVASAERGAAAC
jgi:methylenetetrahydrofolate dehydrogenase (NADP+)/methenyltetrahydrofolate cyclohydrolase